MSDEFSLELSTEVQPAKKFTVDGVEYKMLGLDHLSPADEAEVLALFSRHQILVMELDRERNVSKGRIIAERARTARMNIIGKLTSLPKELREKLPITQQVKLLERIKEELNLDDDEDDEPAETVGDDDDIESEDE